MRGFTLLFSKPKRYQRDLFPSPRNKAPWADVSTAEASPVPLSGRHHGRRVGPRGGALGVGFPERKTTIGPSTSHLAPHPGCWATGQAMGGGRLLRPQNGGLRLRVFRNLWDFFLQAGGKVCGMYKDSRFILRHQSTRFSAQPAFINQFFGRGEGAGGIVMKTSEIIESAKSGHFMH